MDDLAGGVHSMREGDDFSGEAPQKTYVVGRTRSRLRIGEDDARDFSYEVPVDPFSAYLAFQDVPGMTVEAFTERWKRAVDLAYPQGKPDLAASEHNNIGGPGKYAWDLRLMKYMEVRKRADDDINGNQTAAQANAKLRALHDLLMSTFGIHWTRLVNGSDDEDLMRAYKRTFQTYQQTAQSSADPFLNFTAAELMPKFAREVPPDYVQVVRDDETVLQVFASGRIRLGLPDAETVAEAGVRFRQVALDDDEVIRLVKALRDE